MEEKATAPEKTVVPTEAPKPKKRALGIAAIKTLMKSGFSLDTHTEEAPTLKAWEAEIKAAFAGFEGEDVVEQRFALPDDYREFMAMNDGNYLQGDNWAIVFGRKSSLGNLTSLIDLWKPEQGGGMWLPVGNWSDKHEMLLCCDREHPEFGKVADAHDDHPWMSGPDFNRDGTHESFLLYCGDAK